MDHSAPYIARQTDPASGNEKERILLHSKYIFIFIYIRHVNDYPISFLFWHRIVN